MREEGKLNVKMKGREGVGGEKKSKNLFLTTVRRKIITFNNGSVGNRR